jgi:Tol biopolymer transport system component
MRFETWLVNVATSAWTLLDARVGGNQNPSAILDPAWGPDGRRLAFSAHGRGFIRDLSSGADRLLADRPTHYVIDDWTPDGSMILFRERGEGVWGTVWGASPGAPDTSRELFRAQHVRDQQQVSPDGRWIAYNALVSETWEVYVARFPSFTDVQQVSAARGGVQPIWAHDGQRLFYLRFDGTMMGVDLRRDGEVLVADAPRALFTTRLSNPSPMLPEYDVANDGRFLLMEREPGPYTLTVLTNWAPPGS